MYGSTSAPNAVATGPAEAFSTAQLVYIHSSLIAITDSVPLQRHLGKFEVVCLDSGAVVATGPTSSAATNQGHRGNSAVHEAPPLGTATPRWVWWPYKVQNDGPRPSGGGCVAHRRDGRTGLGMQASGGRKWSRHWAMVVRCCMPIPWSGFCPVCQVVSVWFACVWCNNRYSSLIISTQISVA